MEIEKLKENFVSIYGNYGEIRGFMAPGRVNLIGEHIDYNGGHVFPCAITFGNYCIARKRDDLKLRFYSENFKELGIIEVDLNNLKYEEKDNWTNYPKGVFATFIKHGYKINHGFDIYVFGNIPGSGLSSSAAMEVVISNLIKDYFSIDIDDVEIAKYSQEAEVKFCHMNCGIMDQFASANGKKDKAIFLDCNTLKYEYVPLVLKGYKLIVTNSNKPHSLVTSKYNDRRKECEEALHDLQTKLNIKSLCELSVDEFEANKHLIKTETNRIRASFAIYEEDRTKKAVIALQNNDYGTFGKLLNESGDGLHYQYDATCFEIDTLVDLARKQKGCLGSRETGGGWGGNTISLVKEECVDEFKENLEKEYFKKTKLKAGVNILQVGEGGRRIF